ncbi:zinc finger FYVE domain-containing protein 16-like isoform X1 [Sylvia atricapilla]|uniref:zinc finger FYVE domain-containing protein 16-like isoform X1 n=1 Tax=Sylvia atricapilla TaxID=48155 RepID=UPI003393438A
MDSYFKAAVSDLDKLLDEFEQNTDECECFRTPQNPYDSKLSSALDCLEHAHPTPELPEDPARCPAPEESSFYAPVGTSDVLSYSPPKEKAVAVPDLLSTVDSGSLNEIQSLSLERCSIPVCDLVHDTASLIHSVTAHEGTQKLQPDDFQCSKGPAGSGLSCTPIPLCVTSPGCNGAANTKQSDGDLVLQDSGHLTTEQSNNFTLKSESCAAGTVLGPCDDQHRTEPVKCNEVLDHPGQTAALDTVTSQSLNAQSPKDEKACEKLPFEPQDDSACSAASKELCGGNAIGKVEPNDGIYADSMPSDLPKRHPLHNSNATLSRSCVLPVSSCQIGAEAELRKNDAELRKNDTEENLDSEELNSSEILCSVSSSSVSAEDVQTSLSGLSLPVSMCGSSVVTEEKVNPLPQNAVAEVISDTVTVHAGESETQLPRRESCENTSCHEQEDLAEISASIEEKSRDGEKYNTENVIDDGDSQQFKAFSAAFRDFGAEPCSVGLDNFYDESMSSVMADFTVENVIKSDILISDAELDDFLYGQSLQFTVLKSSCNDGNLMEADADGGNLTDLNNLDLMEVSEELTQTKLEEITSISSNLKASIPDNEVEAATEVSMSHGQGMAESGSGALASDVCIKGAKPKQLLDLSQAGQKQLSRTNELETENQESDSGTPEAPLSDTNVNVVNNSDPGESSSEAGGNQTSESAKPHKTPPALSWKQPFWVPDSEAPNCMNCQAKFTFTKRRHHCRACGKVFCGSCCKRKCKLHYMEKEARVCTGCYDNINKVSPLNILPLFHL